MKRFSDGEIQLQILENVRGVDAFAVQPTCTPVEQTLFELLLMIDALKRASAGRITACYPTMDMRARTAKPAPCADLRKLIASLIERAGADRVGTRSARGTDSGFFRYPGGSPVRRAGDDQHCRVSAAASLTVVSPDAGGVERAGRLPSG